MLVILQRVVSSSAAVLCNMKSGHSIVSTCVNALSSVQGAAGRQAEVDTVEAAPV